MDWNGNSVKLKGMHHHMWNLCMLLLSHCLFIYVNSKWALEISPSHLKSLGSEGQWGQKRETGWQYNFKKSLQQKTPSLFWLKLVPYLTGANMSGDMYFALSSKGSSKNRLPTSTILRVRSHGMPWFITCNHQQQLH